MQTVYETRVRVFKAFCDENRLRILELLCQGEKCACVLTDQLGIGQSAVSYHMKILVESGVVLSRQEGKWMHYRINHAGCQHAQDLLHMLTTPNAILDDFVCGA